MTSGAAGVLSIPAPHRPSRPSVCQRGRPPPPAPPPPTPPGLAVIVIARLTASLVVAVVAVPSAPAVPHCLLLRRHGQEGRPQADAGVVQAGAGEERPGPLRVRAHDLVSWVASRRFATDADSNRSTLSSEAFIFILIYWLKRHLPEIPLCTFFFFLVFPS